MADKQKRLVYNFVKFLETCLEDGSIREDDKEGVEVACQCLSEAFSVDPSNADDQQAYSIAPNTLPAVLDAYVQATAATTASSAAAATATAAAAAAPKEPSAEEKAEAEKKKAQGNALMAKKDQQGAIKAYSEAIALDGTNPVYFSNRAAAHSASQDHQSAIADARSALELDPKFAKAYSRLGHALFCAGQYAESVQAYEDGVKLDPTNATMKSSLATAKSKVAASSTRPSVAEDDDDDSSAATRSAPSAGAGNPFGGAGPGGMDFASMMNNPMIQNMAQQMMQGGGLENLMNNPMLRNMFNGAGGEGGMPDIGALMSDPSVRAMAEQFGRQFGGSGGNAGDSNNSDNMYS